MTSRQPILLSATVRFVNARLLHEGHKATDASRRSRTPISETSGDQTGTADVEVEGGHKSYNDVKGDIKTTGERIFSICYSEGQDHIQLR